MSAILDHFLEAGETVDLEVAGEDCGECLKPLEGSGEELAGLVGTDAQGLPGFALFHKGCLENRMLRAL